MQALVDGLKADLARWREALAALPEGEGSDAGRSMIASWIKEGQRLMDRLP